MSYDLHDRKRTINARRREQVRHLIRSVGVELPDGGQVPFFVEPSPGKFRRNPQLKNVDVRDEQLRTLAVEAEIPARIPSGGLPVAALRYLIEMGLRADDEV
jgi:hypothetical protein